MNTKKRDCTVAVPLFEALVLPLILNKQHRSPRRYVRTHTHFSVHMKIDIHIPRTSMLQCVGINEIYQISNSQTQSAYDAFIMSCNRPPLKT